MFFHYCHCHHWHYLKDCFVILCFKSAEVRNSEVDVSKKLKLAGPSLIIGHYYYALVLLDDFAFEASHEECDVTKCNQLNGAAWILPCELSAVLCVCEYLLKPFIRITTATGVTSIQSIETIFCLSSFLIFFHKTTNQLWIEN